MGGRVWEVGLVFQCGRLHHDRHLRRVDTEAARRNKLRVEKCVEPDRRHRLVSWHSRLSEEHTRFQFDCSRDRSGAVTPRATFHFVNEPKNWTAAQAHCRSAYRDLASLGDREEMASMMASASAVWHDVSSSSAWIGLYDDIEDGWHWSLAQDGFYGDGEREFRNWQKGEPDYRRGAENCTEFRLSVWRDKNCSIGRQFICFDGEDSHLSPPYAVMSTVSVVHTRPSQTRPQLPPLMEDGGVACEGGVSDCILGRPCCVIMTDRPFAGTEGSGAEKLVLVKKRLDWRGAQAYCRENHTDLASVRSQAENEAIRALVGRPRVWIGLSRQPWRWSDGRDSTFRSWAHQQPNNRRGEEHCVEIRLKSSTWNDAPCGAQRPFFCYSGELLLQAPPPRPTP
ncbi:hypothetical protein JZ751_004350 [Albula glossodonta]|uniref:C-type lectin domain-containing protein n=1 Tax=Albula glossodonta TaxID=121402 RepID=A0A8T2NGX6_9TELE|nr:hypothetical protein JZ751_004350 [Albula glossodonta]